MDGVRKEQETLREFAGVTNKFELLEERGKALGLPDGWMFEGMGEVAESYRKGKEAFEKEGDVYAVLTPLKNLVQHHEKALQMRAEELQKQEEANRKREQEAEEERRHKREQEEEESKRRKREQQEAEERKRVRRAEAESAMKSVLVVGCIALVAALVWNWCMQNKKQVQERKEKTAKVLGWGTVAGETKTLELPGGARMEMVWCPKESFMMGSPSGEEGRDNDETQHRVTLTKGFWMAKTEVTQKQWLSVMGKNPSYRKGNNLPVECVSWKDCLVFCRETGLSLPTEAQWEYACRAGHTGAYAGSGKLLEMGWSEDNSGGQTHPVGQKKPNAWGLYDMHGNVWEWCADWYDGYPSYAVTNPTGASSGGKRVIRGGGFGDEAAHCRSAFRAMIDPNEQRQIIGFRPVASQN
jgi:formylglycine-generating enzyme required for sulfatase activity